LLKLKGFERNRHLPILSYKIRVLLKTSWQTTNNVSQCSRCFGWVSNSMHSCSKLYGLCQLSRPWNLFYDFKTDVHLIGFYSVLWLMMHRTMNVELFHFLVLLTIVWHGFECLHLFLFFMWHYYCFITASCSLRLRIYVRGVDLTATKRAWELKSLHLLLVGSRHGMAETSGGVLVVWRCSNVPLNRWCKARGFGSIVNLRPTGGSYFFTTIVTALHRVPQDRLETVFNESLS
jgi:hypothetical protein